MIVGVVGLGMGGAVANGSASDAEKRVTAAQTRARMAERALAVREAAVVPASGSGSGAIMFDVTHPSKSTVTISPTADLISGGFVSGP